ncbi:MAG: EscU/YscU/HrcU family type III secretion system export apparatus switch protein [Oscillospiraceae bacterium]|nr:EscU/YscU/HrcU family type III secretion system export apparatus switch protein [Oscillospiraceae bacterium]
MSRYDGRRNPSKKAVALQYEAGNNAPVIVASGMGYMAEKIVEVAADSGVPIYEDNSLATILTQLKLGQEIPEELYRAIVEIYVYFLHFDPNKVEEGAKPKPAPQAAGGGDQAEQER